MEETNNTLQIFKLVPDEVWESLNQKLNIISDLIQKRNVKDDDLKLMDASQVCNLLGVSSKTLQKYRNLRLLPYYKIEQKILMKRSDVEKFLEAHYIPNKGMKN